VRIRGPWLTAGISAAVLLGVLLATGREAGARHPDPRPGVTAEMVLGPGEFPRTPGAPEAYAAARALPDVLDGTYCYCECSKHAGHRSLLTCFESEHGAFCDVCIEEALTAARMHREGRSLEDIRQAIDRRFGS
jgi:hypothetical protein